MIAVVAKAYFLRGMQEAFSYRFAFLLRLIAIGFSLTSFFFLSRFINTSHSSLLDSYGGDYLSFGLVGMILLNLQFTAVSAYPQSIRDAQIAGTLEAMLATPTPGWMVLLCAPIYKFFSSFLWAAVYLVVAGMVFGVKFSSANIVSLAIVVPLCLLSFASIGFFAAALTMLLRRADPISFSLGGMSALLGGVLYPREVLPGWLQSVGKFLPITHALEMVRKATFANASLMALSSSLADLSLFCMICVPSGILFFSYALRRARKDGSLTHY